MSKQLIIPWDALRDEIKFATLDDNDNIYGHTNEPSIGILCGWWDCKYPGEEFDLNILKIDTEGVDWRNSLTKRPE